MKFGIGTLFVVVGVLVLWLAVTGRLANLDAAWRVLRGEKDADVKPIGGPGRRATTGVLSQVLNIPSGADFPVLPTLGFANASQSEIA